MVGVLCVLPSWILGQAVFICASETMPYGVCQQQINDLWSILWDLLLTMASQPLVSQLCFLCVFTFHGIQLLLVGMGHHGLETTCSILFLLSSDGLTTEVQSCPREPPSLPLWACLPLGLGQGKRAPAREHHNNTVLICMGMGRGRAAESKHFGNPLAIMPIHFASAAARPEDRCPYADGLGHHPWAV